MTKTLLLEIIKVDTKNSKMADLRSAEAKEKLLIARFLIATENLTELSYVFGQQMSCIKYCLLE